MGYGGGYGYYDTGYGYGYPPYGEPAYGGVPQYSYAAPAPQYSMNEQEIAPVQTGRSAAVAGNSCTTPAKVCTLYQPSYVGIGCSCRVPGGRARGTVTP